MKTRRGKERMPVALGIRVLREERFRLKHAAQVRGLTLSEFVRDTMLAEADAMPWPGARRVGR